MVLVVMGVVEQRLQAVLEVVNQGRTVTEVAERYGVARQTVHRWLRRYEADGLDGWRTGHIAPTPVRIRCRLGWKQLWWRYGWCIPIGVRNVSPGNWNSAGSWRRPRRVRLSIGV
jgi:transposase